MRIATLLTAVLCIATPCASGSVFVSSRLGLSGSDSLLMSAFGPSGTTLASGTSANTANLNTVTVTDSGSFGFSVLQQNDQWSGNFANGDFLLWTGNINTLDFDTVPVTLTFGSAVAGVGLQIQPDTFGGSFTASIAAFNASNVNIGSFTSTGFSTSAGDNSALFLGVLSSAADIKKITINITSPAGVDFAFNELTFADVPEPASTSLFLLGAAILPALSRRRRSGRIALHD